MADLMELKNIHAGRGCLVLGNGPSLTTKLLDSMDKSGVFGFSANGFWAVFGRTGYRPDAVCMSNYDAVTQHGSHYPPETLKFFKLGSRGLLGQEPGNLYELPFPCEHDKGTHEGPFIKDGHFAVDPGKETFCGDTVLLDFAVPLACYMGFKRIYLAGVDCDYTKGYLDPALCIRARKGFKGMVHGDYSISIPSYRFCFEFLDRKGVGLFKLTASERLNFIPTMDYETFLKKEKP